MDIIVSQEQGQVPVTIFQIKGELSAATAGPLQTQAEQAYSAGARYMLVDLSQVPFMSSAGLRVIHSMFNMLRSESPDESDDAVRKGLAQGTFKSPHLKLLRPNKNILQVLSTAGYDMFLEIHQDLKEAVASF